MKKALIFIVALFALIFTGCSKDTSDGDPIQTIRYSLPPQTSVFSLTDTLHYGNIAFLHHIISQPIAEQAMEDSASLAVTAHRDSLFITEIDFSAYHVQYHIQFPRQDSVSCRVHVEKPILKGGSIYQVLTDLGMKPKDVGFYAWKMGEFIDATSIDVGDIFTVDYHLDSLNTKQFEKFSYKPDKISIHEFTITGERELKYTLVELPYELRRRYLTGQITEEFTSMDAVMNELGIIPYIRQQANNAMASQVAFSTDARIGDTFEVYIEEKYVDGELQPRGKMLYVQYSGKVAHTKSAFRFDDEAEASAFTGMYTPAGKRLVTDAVRTPLDRMHISSPFGYRIHPILGTRRMHHGIDLRGNSGTPIYAVTQGTVIKAADTGNGYGKEVRIRHDNGMITQYAHMSRITTRKGRRVKKGQLIGKVGNTGLSTGPHLHFGVMKNGRWVNPKTNLKMVGANQLKKTRLARFKKQMEAYKAEIAALQQEAASTDSVSVHPKS
ncbi:MAG: M23 family metallopeptidase [Candidatus Cloacimonetes bacterium]|nr:M23 family metallopeptidase [Candidatus Cloacimonadota bacterium]